MQIPEIIKPTSFRMTVAIATANRPKFVVDCLKSVKAVGAPADLDVLVIDGGREAPVDEALLQQVWPGVRVIRSPQRNLAIQRNEGIRRAKHEIVCFLDDDVYVQPGWWPGIVEPFLESDVGAVAGAVWCTMTPKLISTRGGYVNWRGEPIQVTHRSASAPREVDWTIGCNTAFRKSAAEAIGGLAVAYGIYDEDVDFGLRLKRAGWRVVYLPNVPVYHYFTLRSRPPPSKASEFRDGRNRAMLLVRNYGFSSRLVMYCLTTPCLKAGQAIMKVSHCVVQAAVHFAAYLLGMMKGIVDGVRHPLSRDKENYDREGIREE
jgi:GT2 family glycosyltransferase